MKELYILKEPLNKIKNASDIFKRIEKFNINFEQENFIIFYLNNQNKVIKGEILFKGGINSCVVCPNTIFRKALLNKSNKIIIAHNHPSGELKPSCEDIDIYNKLINAGEMINIDILDSIIFNKKEFYSLKNEIKE